MASEAKRTAGIEHAAALAAAIDAAEAAAILPCGGPYGRLEMPDPVYGACCIGSAIRGPQYCTCWTAEYDLEQAGLRPGKPGRRAELCGDCAYKPGSPERLGDDRYTGDGEFLDRIVEDGESFFCHQGIRRAVRLVHPSGDVVELFKDPPGDYRPPIVDDIPYKADGSPADLCAGWAARRQKHLGLASRGVD